MPRKVRTRARKSADRKSSARESKQPQADSLHSHQGYFERFACYIAHLAGRPTAFLLALTTIVVWAVSGPLFGYSDTWQLVINTSTTIITFLMVFLIQNSQNRDTTALQIKLDALIFASRGTKNTIAAAEHLSDSDLEQLHDEYHKRAEQTLAVLHHRRPARTNAA
jgi:low affinity Fe/Cu permease